MSRKILFKIKHGTAVKMEQQMYDTPSFNGVFPDLVYLQNVPSMVAVNVLDPKVNQKICYFACHSVVQKDLRTQILLNY